MIGIISALPFEGRFLTAHGFLVHVSGVGAECAAHGARYLIDQGAKALISWGIAGGLEPTLRTGCIVIPDKIIDLKSNVYTTDEYLKKQIKQKLQLHLPSYHGPLLQTDQVITSVQEKKNLFKKYQAHAIDMESAAIAGAAKEANLSFTAIRVIIDSAHMSLPHWLPHSFNDKNKLHAGRFISGMCRYPLTWHALMKLVFNSIAARRSLKKAAQLLNFSEINSKENFSQPIINPETGIAEEY